MCTALARCQGRLFPVADEDERRPVAQRSRLDRDAIGEQDPAALSQRGELPNRRVPRAFHLMEDLLALADVDAVVISTGDFQHAPILKLAAEAGKDAYCEKPFANDLDDAKAARDAVLGRNLVVQIGTQHRSEPYQ